MTSGDQTSTNGPIGSTMSTSQPVAGAIVTTIERAWVEIQRRHPDVPAVVVTMGQGSGSGALKLGHFAAGRWAVGAVTMHELFVGAGGLRRGAVDVLGTLLHEAAHGAAAQRQIKDTSRQGRYHNTRFRKLGEEFGLTLERDERIGWSVTTVPEATAAAYAPTLAELDQVLVAYRHAEVNAADPDGKPKPAGTPALECGCGRKVRASRAVAEAGPIICGLCGTEFETPDDEDETEQVRLAVQMYHCPHSGIDVPLSRHTC